MAAEPSLEKTGDTDTVLVNAAKAGDREAFNLLVLKHQRRVYRVCARYLGSSDELDDVVQETFINAFRAIPQFRAESLFSTWLLTIAANAAKKALVERKKRQQHEIHDFVADNEDGETFSLFDALSVNETTPEHELAGKQLVQALEQAMKMLTADHREALVLREIEGLSYEAIGEIIDCPPGTVRSRIYRARESIAKQLEPFLNRHGKKRW